MRKIILNLAVSLDSFIEGPNGEFDWCLTDQDYGMKELMERIDTIFFGRKSYEVMLNFDSNPYPDKMKYVFSNSYKVSSPFTEIIGGDIVKEIKLLKAKPGKDIWLFGGAELISILINNKLVDEFQLSVHPLLLGNGKVLFSEIKERVQLKLLRTMPYTSGLVQLFYEPEYG